VAPIPDPSPQRKGHVMKRLLVVAVLLCSLLAPPATAAASGGGGSSGGVAATAVALSSDPSLNVEEGMPSETVTARDAFAVVQVAGSERVGTAIAASRLAFPGTADTIVLCTGWKWPDALGGAALAGASNGPLLLTRPDVLPSSVVTEAARLDAHHVVIVGGESTVSSAVANALATADINGHGLDVTRIAGHDRFDTSAMLASATVAAMKSHGRTYDGTAFFTTGYSFPDAVAASPLAARKGWPVLLVDPAGIATTTADAIGALGVKRGIILGSERSVPASAAVRLAEILPTAPERLQGDDRYLTALKIAQLGVDNGLSWDGVGITTGDNFPDALAGGVMQGKLGSVLVLTTPTYLRRSVFDELTARRATIHTVRYLGDTKAVRPFARDGVTAALYGDPYPTTNGMTFPVDGPVEYEDSFGAPRSGGRTHEGCDIMAARNTPVVATLSGTVTSKEGGLGGKVIYLQADNGWRFYYAHLNGWAVTSGRVHQGQKIGYVGNTGNAAGGPTHCHFQMWTPSGALVNPYPYLLKMLR
jgi:murein DD-endopeptidase MepM/ murein hydrolase activator NlpD